MLGDYGSSRYTASTGSTTTGTSGTSSGAAPGGASAASGGAVRRVRLARPPTGASAPCAPPTFGFSVRGGREHSTGFFVSHVEPDSEACNQGLKVGDQVVRVNGFRVGDALHKELLCLISGLNYLKLKVRNVGMIPVKDKPTDPLTWRMIPETMLYSDRLQRSSSPIINVNKDDKPKDVRLTLYVPSKAKLGCGICKGPEWRPGIFVQFIKENGIAKESGLRPGDQIMQCNGIDFRDITFSDAVSLMKQAKRLDLWVRTGAGLDLFPGESSGYNSSASSATGDQSPSSADLKRLSIVKEETLDLEDRLSQLDNGRYKRKTWDSRSFDWERENSIRESDSECANDYREIQVNGCAHRSIYNGFEDNEKVIPQNRTIINLSENGTTIQTNYVLPNEQIGSRENKATVINTVNDKKTIIVDVHRSDYENKDDKGNVTNIQCQNQDSKPTLKKVPSSSSIVSMTNSTSSLSNAIAQELQKRNQRKKDNNFNVDQLEENRKNKLLKGVDDEKKQQHDALMDEFKRAHRKMFAGNSNMENEIEKRKPEETLKEKGREDIVDSRTKLISPIPDRHTNYSKISTIPRDHSAPAKPINANITNGVSNNMPKRNYKPPDQPPPPPPMPINDKISKPEGTSKVVATHTKPKAPPPPPLKKFQQNGGLTNGFHENGFNNKPPTTPTPDYDTSSLIKVTNKPKVTRSKTEIVEMESLESFKLSNPSSPTPKPPSTYFMKQPSETLTMKKATQQISVTIGEYPSNTFRKQPSKLEFLNGDTPDGNYKTNEPVGSRLQSELSQMLSRSNLKKKTEADNHINGISKLPENPFDSVPGNDEPNANFNKRYGHVVLPQPPTITIPKVPITKSLSHNVTVNGTNDTNRVTISSPIPNGKTELTKSESLPQNGILKNSAPLFINDHYASATKIGIQHKTIKFGHTTTVIGEPELIANH